MLMASTASSLCTREMGMSRALRPDEWWMDAWTSTREDCVPYGAMLKFRVTLWLVRVCHR
jgi:hypothetical protein